MSIAAVGAADSATRNRFGRQLAGLLRPARGSLIVIAALVLTGALFELMPPVLIRWIVDDHLAVGRSDGLFVLALWYLAAISIGQGLAFVYGYLAAAVAQGVLSNLRVRLFDHLQRLPASHFDQTPLGDAISRCTADIDTLDTMFTSGVATLVANLFRLITIAAAMIILSPVLSLAAAVVLPPLVIITRFFQVRIREAERATRRAVGEMNTHLQETLRGVEVIQAFKRESRFVARFRRVLQRVLQAANRSTIYSSFYPPMTAMLTYSTIAFLLWAGTRDTWSALGTFGMPDISIGTLTAFALLLQRFFTPVTALGDEWQTVQGALSGAERIFEVLTLPADDQPRVPPRRDAQRLRRGHRRRRGDAPRRRAGDDCSRRPRTRPRPQRAAERQRSRRARTQLPVRDRHSAAHAAAGSVRAASRGAGGRHARAGGAGSALRGCGRLTGAG